MTVISANASDIPAFTKGLSSFAQARITRTLSWTGCSYRPRSGREVCNQNIDILMLAYALIRSWCPIDYKLHIQLGAVLRLKPWIRKPPTQLRPLNRKLLKGKGRSFRIGCPQNLFSWMKRPANARQDE